MEDRTTTASEHPGKRRFSRIPISGSTRIRWQKLVWQVRLLDLSLKGALVTRPQDWQVPVGEECSLEIQLDGGIFIQMTVEPVWDANDVVGFCCQRIGIDSFTELKRFVELNLGQPELLNRELSALG